MFLCLIKLSFLYFTQVLRFAFPLSGEIKERVQFGLMVARTQHHYRRRAPPDVKCKQVKSIDRRALEKAFVRRRPKKGWPRQNGKCPLPEFPGEWGECCKANQDNKRLKANNKNKCNSCFLLIFLEIKVN